MIHFAKSFQDDCTRTMERFNKINKLYNLNISWGAEVEYMCEEGYKLRGKIINAARDTSGQWLITLLPYNCSFTIEVHPTARVKYL